MQSGEVEAADPEANTTKLQQEISVGVDVYSAGDDPDPEGHGDHGVRASRHQPDAGVHLQ